MMATVPHVTSGLGLRKFQADGFLLTRAYSTGYSCQIVTKLEFSRQIFEKYSNINFMIVCPAGTELFHARGRDEAKSRFSQSWEPAEKNVYFTSDLQTS